MKTLFLIISITFIFFKALHSQTNETGILFSKGNVSEKGGSGNEGVDLSQGLIQPSFNLTTLKSSNHSYKISLIYTGGSGIKVNETASCVGTGWKLGGLPNIKRTVRNIPDDHFRFYQYNSQTSAPAGQQISLYPYLYNYNLLTWLHAALPIIGLPAMKLYSAVEYYKNQTPQGNMTWQEWRDKVTTYFFKTTIGDTINTDTTYTNTVRFDSEPDLFTFELNGYSGSFVIKDNNTLIHTPYSDLKIYPSVNFSPVSNNTDENWIIITPDGTKYYFKDTEEYYDVSEKKSFTGKSDDPYTTYMNEAYKTYNYVSQWNVSKIEFANGETMEFIYEETSDLEIWNKQYHKLFRVCDPESFTDMCDCQSSCGPLYATLGPYSIHEYERIINMKRIKQIKADDDQLEFIYNTTQRSDLPNHYSLDRIINYRKNRLSAQLDKYEEIRFETSYYNNGNGRLKLDRFTYLPTRTGDEEIRFSFNYYEDENLPEYFHHSQDMWGYYNLNTDIYMIPNQGVCNFGSNSDRSPNFERNRANVLEEIIYPTGGKVKYEYEQNNYPKQGQNHTTGGLRVKKIISSTNEGSNNDKTTEYKYIQPNSTLSSGTIKNQRKENDLIVHPGHPMCNQTVMYLSVFSTPRRSDHLKEHIRYSRVEEIISGKGKTVYTYTNHDDSPDSEPERITFNRFVSSQNLIYGDYFSDIDNDPGTPFSDKSYTRGLLKTEEIYNETGDKLSENINEYDDIELDYVRGLRVSSSHDFTSLCNFCGYPFTEPLLYTEYYKFISGFMRLKQSKSRVYDVTNNLVNESRTDYYYDNTIPPAHLNVKETHVENSDGTIYSRKYRYAFDLDYNGSITQFNNEAEAIESLKSMNIKNAIIESISLVKEIGSTFKILSGTLQTYRLSSSGKPYVYENYALSTGEPIDNFQEAELADDGNEVYLIKDSRYELMQRTITITDKLSPITIQGRDGVSISAIHDHSDKTVIATIHNATYEKGVIGNECSFADFENTKHNAEAHDHWDSEFNFTYSEKYSGQQSLIISSQSTTGYGMRRLFNPDDKTRKYKLSAWVKTESGLGNNAGILQLKAIRSDNENSYAQSHVPSQISQITFGDSDGEWVYVETMLDVPAIMTEIASHNGLPAPYFEAIISCQDANKVFYVDNVCFKPADAKLTGSYIYDPVLYLKTESYDINGICTGYAEYDSYGRVKWILNKDKEVISKHDYFYKNATDKNRIVNVRMRKPYSKTQVENNFNSIAWNEYNLSTSFLDGLGRTIQTVEKTGSPFDTHLGTGKDIVSFMEYDEYGMTPVAYLPYTSSENNGFYKSGALQEHADFYQTAGYIENSDYPFAASVYEDTPLKRITEQGFAGDAWQPGSGHTARKEYLLNEQNEVRIWNVNNISGGAAGNNFYDAGTLLKIKTIDEEDKETMTYFDKLGRKVCVKRKVAAAYVMNEDVTFDYTDGGSAINQQYQITDKTVTTYYIYDISGRLKYIIPHGMTAAMENSNNYNFDENTTLFNEFVFAVKYDNKGRICSTKKPGMGWDYIVYDKADRIILTQTAEQKNEGKWNFVKRDIYGRIVIGGIMSSTATQQQMQNDANASIILWENRTADNQTNFGYTNAAFPILTSHDDEIHIINYYDDYSFDKNGYDFIPGLYAACNNKAEGLKTGMKIRILGSNQFLTNVTYYDDKYRAIQTFNENHLGGMDKTDIEYDWPGQVTNLHRTHQISQFAVEITNRFEYDHTGRIMAAYQKTGDTDPEVLLANYSYNDLGQVIQKSIHQPDGYQDFLQNIDYRYNIRGWLKKINNATLVPDQDNADYNDVFGEELEYHLPDVGTGGLTAIPKFDGNASVFKWKLKNFDTGGEEVNGHAYAYRYDDMSRMTAAYYGRNSFNDPFTYDQAVGFYNEILSYDLKENIRTLFRKGNEGKVIDNLAYEYYNNGNRLKSIADAATSSVQMDFHDVSNTTDYLYDDNGNRTDDFNKDIHLIYNHFNFPIIISKNSTTESMEYVYDATGRRLSKTINGVTWNYVNGVEYKGNTMVQIATAEGRVRQKDPRSINTTEYVYDYFIKDHLGNVRAIITEEELSNDYLASMEEGRSGIEEEQFLFIPETREDRPLTAPTDTTTIPNERGSIVNAQNPVGHAKVLAMMQGDKVSFDTRYFFQSAEAVSGNYNGVQNLISQLANLFSGATATGGGEGQNWAEAGTNAGLISFLTTLLGDVDTSSGEPSAFLTWLFFDREFNLVEEASGLLRADEPDVLGEAGMMNIKAPTDGFMYIYTSNESMVNVMFDNLRVRHTRGRVLEMNHYYPYGMVMERLSFSTPYMVANLYKYQGKEMEREMGLWTMDFGLRQYDPATARWSATDPYMQFANPYIAMANNPVLLTDPDGGRVDGSRLKAPIPEIPRDSKGRMIDDEHGGGGYSKWGNPRYSRGYVDELGHPLPDSYVMAMVGQGNIEWTSEIGNSCGKDALKEMSDGVREMINDITNALKNQGNSDPNKDYIPPPGAYNLPPATIEEIRVSPDKIAQYAYDHFEVYSYLRDNASTSGWTNLQTGLGAFNLANGAKTELIDYAIRSNYKSARTYGEFNKLRPTQQAWRTTNTLGKTGASYLKFAKGLGTAGFVAGSGYSGYTAYDYYFNQNGSDWQVGGKATLDIIMGGAAFFGPIGFGISATYFILDNATGGFGGFGSIKP